MIEIKQLIPSFSQIKVKGPTSEYASMISRVIEFMGEKNDRFPYWCGRLARFSSKPYKILDLMNEAKNGRNSKALFQYLIKCQNPSQKKKSKK